MRLTFFSKMATVEAMNIAARASGMSTASSRRSSKASWAPKTRKRKVAIT